jgi:hypothetical protein
VRENVRMVTSILQPFDDCSGGETAAKTTRELRVVDFRAKIVELLLQLLLVPVTSLEFN